MHNRKSVRRVRKRKDAQSSPEVTKDMRLAIRGRTRKGDALEITRRV